jgi:hypothetical protein
MGTEEQSLLQKNISTWMPKVKAKDFGGNFQR